jgi:hypothetical protein
VTPRPGSGGETTRHEPTTRWCEGCNALTQAAAKESIRRDVESNTMKENHKHADAVMAAKIDRLERKVREGTKRMEEARDASVRYRRERDEYKAELDRANKELDRAWATCTGLANAPRGPPPYNSSFIEMANPRDEEREDRAQRDEKIARAQASQRETAAKAKVEHARIQEMCLKDPLYLPGNGRTRADYVPAERESSTRQPSPPRKRPYRGDPPNPFTHSIPRHRNPARQQSTYGPAVDLNRPAVDLTGYREAYTPGNQRGNVDFDTDPFHINKAQRKENARDAFRESQGEWPGDDLYGSVVFDKTAEWYARAQAEKDKVENSPGFLFEDSLGVETRDATVQDEEEADAEEAEAIAAAEAIHREQTQTYAVGEGGTNRAPGTEEEKEAPAEPAAVAGGGDPPTTVTETAAPTPPGPPEEAGTGNTGTTTTLLHVRVDPRVTPYGQWPDSATERAAARRRDFPLPIRTKARDTEEARK